MRIAIGSDMQNHVTDAVLNYLQKTGHEVIKFGALNPSQSDVVKSCFGAGANGCKR